MSPLSLLKRAIGFRGMIRRRAGHRLLAGLLGAWLAFPVLAAAAENGAASAPSARSTNAIMPDAPGSPGAAAAPIGSQAQTEHARLTLLAEHASVAPNSSIMLAFSLRSIPHWHTYWKNPGDTGLPTRINWTLPEGVTAGSIIWPTPSRLPTPPLMSFGYEGTAVLLVPLTVADGVRGPLDVHAKVRWLVCAEQCVPENAEVALQLPVQPPTDAGDAVVRAALAAAPVAAAGWQIQAQQNGATLRIDGTVPAGQTVPARLWFFPDQKDVIAPAAAQPFAVDGQHFALTVPLIQPHGSGAGAAAGAVTPVGASAAEAAVASATTLSPPATGPGAMALSQPLAGLLVSDGPPETRRAWTFAAPLAHVDQLTPVVDRAPTPWQADGQPGPAGASGLAALAVALGLAFVGGMLLNLMPCVLPVLSIKVFALLGEAHASRRRLALQGGLFLAGVLVSFWVLAGLLLGLKAAGASVGWGFQLQSPGFVVLLAILFTLLALNFAGLFEIGLGLQARAGDLEQRAGHQGSALFASFSSGVLTTLVATPCTAPFLGAGIGFTLERSAFEALLVFTAMGLGVGLPVTLLALFPAWLTRVPRPGAWMQTLKQLFAFPMLATVAWLCWVLGHQRGVDAIGLLLLGLTLVAMAAWLYGRWQVTMAMGRVGLQPALAVVLLLTGLWIAWPRGEAGALENTAMGRSGEASAPADAPAWLPYSDSRLAELRAQHKTVFVDFTAAWCISCQVNKRTSLHTLAVSGRMKALGVAALEADWSNASPEITAALGRLHRNAVPVYAVYPADGGEPRLLPEVLTPAIVIDALEHAAKT